MKDMLIVSSLVSCAVGLVFWFRDIGRVDCEAKAEMARKQSRREGFEKFLHSIRQHLSR